MSRHPSAVALQNIYLEAQMGSSDDARSSLFGGRLALAEAVRAWTHRGLVSKRP
jgi:hypothetical protein